MTYVEELQEILKANEKRLQNYGDKIRIVLVLPICKKHRLEFISGNGRYFFMNSKGDDFFTPQDVVDGRARVSRTAAQAITRIYEVLSASVDQARDVGDLIGDVRKGKDF